MDAASATTVDGLIDPLSIPVRVRAFSKTALTRFRTCSGEEDRPSAALDQEEAESAGELPSTFLLLSAKKRSEPSAAAGPVLLPLVVVIVGIRDEDIRRETHFRIPKAVTTTPPRPGFQ